MNHPILFEAIKDNATVASGLLDIIRHECPQVYQFRLIDLTRRLAPNMEHIAIVLLNCPTAATLLLDVEKLVQFNSLVAEARDKWTRLDVPDKRQRTLYEMINTSRLT